LTRKLACDKILKNSDFFDFYYTFGMGAFGCCAALENISIPNSIQSFGIDEMFKRITNNKSHDFQGFLYCNEYVSLQILKY
jgi:hypothetical protein